MLAIFSLLVGCICVVASAGITANRMAKFKPRTSIFMMLFLLVLIVGLVGVIAAPPGLISVIVGSVTFGALVGLHIGYTQ